MSQEFDLDKLKVWEVAGRATAPEHRRLTFFYRSITYFYLSDLGVQATKKIIESPEPLRMLRDISQNLPILAHTLAREPVTNGKSNHKGVLTLEEERLEISKAADLLQDYQDVLWINSIPYSIESVDPFMYFI